MQVGSDSFYLQRGNAVIRQHTVISSASHSLGTGDVAGPWRSTVIGAHNGAVRRLHAALAQRRGAVRALVRETAPRAAVPPQHELLTCRKMCPSHGRPGLSYASGGAKVHPFDTSILDARFQQ